MSENRSVKRIRPILISAVLAVVIALLASSCSYEKPDNTQIPEPSNISSNTTDIAGNTADADDSNINTGSDISTDIPGNNTAPSDPQSETETNTNENNTVLTETKYADRNYIDETLFLGDSNTAKYLEYTDAKGQSYSTVRNTIGIYSMGIEHIRTLRCMSFATGTFTIPDSVSVLQPRRMIIMFGTNNLKDYGVRGAKSFADNYAAQIKIISDAYPDADIIINSVPPATRATLFMTARIEVINAFNKAIEDMCAKNGWKFLNSFEALTDDTGYGDPDLFESDGLHLNQKGIEAMFDYIRSHALYTEDRRHMPLKEIPEINGPLVKMLL